MIRALLARIFPRPPKPETRTEAQMRADHWREVYERYWSQWRW